MHMFFAATALAVASSAHAGVVLVGIADPAQETSIWAIDEFTGQASSLLTGFEVQGLAADDASGELFFTTGTQIFRWGYDGQSAPEMILDLNDMMGARGETNPDVALSGLAFTDSGMPGGRTLVATGLSAGILTTFTLAIDAEDGEVLASTVQGPDEAVAVTSLDILNIEGVPTLGAAYLLDIPQQFTPGLTLFDPALGLPMTGDPVIDTVLLSEVAMSEDSLFVAPLVDSPLGENILVVGNSDPRGTTLNGLPIPYEFTPTLVGGGGAYSAIIPAPGGVMMAFGGLVLVGRRRRR